MFRFDSELEVDADASKEAREDSHASPPSFVHRIWRSAPISSPSLLWNWLDWLGWVATVKWLDQNVNVASEPSGVGRHDDAVLS